MYNLSNGFLKFWVNIFKLKKAVEFFSVSHKTWHTHIIYMRIYKEPWNRFLKLIYFYKFSVIFFLNLKKGVEFFSDSHKTWHTCTWSMWEYTKIVEQIFEILIFFKIMGNFFKFKKAVKLSRPLGLAS